MKKILYDGKIRNIDEIEIDHIHLDDGTVIHNNEIIKLPNLWISKYNQRKELKNITKNYIKLFDKMIKFYNGLKKIKDK